MNTTKLFSAGTNYILSCGNGLKYLITPYAVVRVALDTENLTEVPFDVTVQGMINNALEYAGNVVMFVDEIKLIEALVQEKIEDFD